MSITLVKGSDPVVLSEAAAEAVRSALDGRDRTEVLDEFRGDEYALGEVVLAASTVSMFGDRVVVARNMARFTAAELAPLVDLLADVVDGVSLVLVWDRPVTSGDRANAVPKKVADAVKKAGGDVVDSSPPSGKGRRGWVDERFEVAGVRLDPAARRLVEDTLGEDVGRLGGMLDVLAASNPQGSTLGVEEVLPFLGEAGGVPPWELTDAIDSGATAVAVTKARRMMGAGGRHPLQVMVTLQSHVERMLRLDGANARNEKDAAALLGMKGSTFPAKKALAQSTRLGHARLVRATQLLAEADVQLRGSTGAPADAVLELLVARLAALSAAGTTRRAGHDRR